MKIFFFLSFLFFAKLSFAADKLVDYRFGNQIKGSTLTIFSDGQIVHTERTCCPPRTDDLIEKNLNIEELKNLILFVEKATLAGQSTYRAGQSGNGSSAGTLTAFRANATQFNIRTIEFGDGIGGPQPVHFNVAAEAREIESLVFALVLQKMIY